MRFACVVAGLGEQKLRLIISSGGFFDLSQLGTVLRLVNEGIILAYPVILAVKQSGRFLKGLLR